MREKLPGKSHYKDDTAVADGNLITACSAGGLPWARFIFERLELYTSETIEAWYNYFAAGNTSYFGKLMDTFSKI